MVMGFALFAAVLTAMAFYWEYGWEKKKEMEKTLSGLPTLPSSGSGTAPGTVSGEGAQALLESLQKQLEQAKSPSSSERPPKKSSPPSEPGILDRLTDSVDGEGMIEFTPESFQQVGGFACGRARILAKAPKGMRWGYIDKSRTIVIPVVFHNADSFSANRAAVSRGKGWGYIDVKGKLVIPHRFDEAGPFIGGRAEVVVGVDRFHIDPAGKRIDP
jgi:hypothetical protein